MKHKYGDFSQKQFDNYKVKLHSKVHFLLIYKEENADNFFPYFETVMQYISGLNKLLEDNALIIDLLVTLQVALDEASKKDGFDFKVFRKNILEAHNIIDRL